MNHELHPDWLMLEVLERTDSGESMSSVARRLTQKTGTEISRNTVIGISNRIRNADAETPDHTNTDGRMGPKWKRAGLLAQEKGNGK